MTQIWCKKRIWIYNSCS